MENRMKLNNSIRRKLRMALPLLSLFVVLGVFWWLKLTGLTLAGEAFCGMKEHVHGDDCNVRLVCTATEDRLHTHEQACWQQTLRCTLPETEGHAHTEGCTNRTLVCEEEHAHDEVACYRDVLTCGKEAQAPHTHSEECYEQTLVCELAELGAHEHTDACYESTCGLQAHIHMETCYSNITADLETAVDWEQLVADITEEHGTREKVVRVAKSQLGYQESTANFQVDAAGVRRGITRYGQWYGNPYGDWSAMFVSFCLHYAGVKDVPTNGGPEAMRVAWEAKGFYETEPQNLQIGNLLFLQKDNEKTADRIAIITAVEETVITVVEGDLDGKVAESKYAMDDAAILGYGNVPSSDSVVLLETALAAAGDVTVWLDGTNGGMGHLKASADTPYTVQKGSVLKLPETWPSPDKYSYKLRGWYDISNSKYYLPGAEMEVTGNAVLYADWVATTYDVGVYNNQVVNTASTNDFITTHVFDYNYLFDLHSTKATITVDAEDHTEKWSLVSTGKVAHGDQNTLNFVFVSNDSSGLLCDVSSRNDNNSYHSPSSGDQVWTGIYSAALGEALFGTNNAYNPATGEGILGKTYVGTGDHLYRLMDDPTDEHYGYYYYDSKRNAASYNQSAGRFYLYNYLEATSDSIGGAYSDFLPFNSPYANTNGKNVGTYSYDGVNGEYKGTTHYRYDSKNNSSGDNSPDNMQANYGYGMRSDIDFFLPNDPGDANGNKDLYGNDMQFQFSGDDDVWVLLDGALVLDIGGIHQVSSGYIDFSTGYVEADGQEQTNLKNLGITAGEHVLTILYLERGSSMSNCAIYFNLAPRYQLTIQKEDVLTRHLLDNAEFAVYTDRNCKNLAQLWNSKAENDAGMAPRESFVVDDGSVTMWGFAANETYYIKEIAPPRPDNVLVGESPYSYASGLISLHIDRLGNASYDVQMLAELDAAGNPVPIDPGFTAYGFRFDEETHQAYLVVTNAEDWVQETTEITAAKKWADNKDHSGDAVTVYLTVTDPDDTVRRLQNMVLSEENGWQYTWQNMPKYQRDGVTPIVYGVEEELVPGYYGTVEEATKLQNTTVSWQDAASFVKDEQYLLKTNKGYLSTTASNTLAFVDEQTAKSSALALWTASSSGTASKLTNGAGLTLVYNSGNSSSSRYFTVTTSSSGNTSITIDANGRMYYNANTDYYFKEINASNGRGTVSNRTNDALSFTRVVKSETTTTVEVKNLTYLVTNTPLDRATSVTVKKEWNTEQGGADLYETLSITVRLYENGRNTGRTVSLNLQNGWTNVFQNLPYTDAAGRVIVYTVEELLDDENWKVSYSTQTDTTGETPTYSVTVTNTYESHKPSVELPATGSAAQLLCIAIGGGLMLLALAAAIVLRRKRYA